MTQNSQENAGVNNDSYEYNASQSPGRYLQKERLQKQLSLEEVAAQTCISLGTLRAIEENDRSKMPAEVFTRGFIKLYAQSLGLDPQIVLDRYNSETGHSEEETIRNHEVFQNEKMAESSIFFNLRFFFIILIFLVFVGFGVYFFFYSSSSAPTTSSSSSYTGQTPLSSQINQKFHAVEAPTQSPSFSPPSQGDTYSAPSSSPENNLQRESTSNEAPGLPPTPNNVPIENSEGSPSSATTATENSQTGTPNNTQGIFTPVR